MSALNHTAPRFRQQAPSPLPGGFPFNPAAATQDVPPRLAHAFPSMPITPIATPLAPPPPPPMHLAASQPHTRGVPYAGVDHTLGPSFSDDEETDDLDLVAAKMSGLGIGPSQQAELQRRVQAHQQHLIELQILRQQQQQQQQQHQQLPAMLSPTEALAILEHQRAQLSATNAAAVERAYLQQAAAQQLVNQRVLQHQILALQAQQAAVQGRRQALAAQLEAGTLRRERERAVDEDRVRAAFQFSPEEHRARAAFESAPSGYFPPITSPVGSAAGVGWTSTSSSSGKTPASEWPSGWNSGSSEDHKGPRSASFCSTRCPSPPVISPTPPPSSAPPAALGRFARARQELAAAQAAAPGATPLAALLSRRKGTDDDSGSVFSDTVATSSPVSEYAPHRPGQRTWSNSSERQVVSESGHIVAKDPASYLEWGYHPPAPRSQSFSHSRCNDDAHRSQSFSHFQPSLGQIARQPYGPPGSWDELGQKNFASRIRRQAGINLGMLGRRTESGDA